MSAKDTVTGLAGASRSRSVLYTVAPIACRKMGTFLSSAICHEKNLCSLQICGEGSRLRVKLFQSAEREGWRGHSQKILSSSPV